MKWTHVLRRVTFGAFKYLLANAYASRLGVWQLLQQPLQTRAQRTRLAAAGSAEGTQPSLFRPDSST